MNYSEALHFFNSLKSLERREYADLTARSTHGTNYFFKRMRLFLNILGNPEKKIPHIIHVAGTSGKGSVCNYLSTIFTEAGYRTGLFMSPHISDIRERWQINNHPIPKEEFVRIMEKIKPALETYLRKQPYDAPSPFEIITIIGFIYFAEQKVDYVILEVGLGGRLDATNVIANKDMAVITDIGLDHTKILGKTITAIAREKAGIITTGAPIFTMSPNTSVHRILKERATLKKAPIYFSQLTNEVKKSIKITKEGTEFTFNRVNYTIKALGQHQVRNALLALTVAQHAGISIQKIKRGLQKTSQPLRFEILQGKPTYILDGAHNPQKIESTVETMKALTSEFHNKKIHIILGFFADKNTTAMIKKLVSLAPESIACTKNTVSEGRKVMNPSAIAKIIASINPRIRTEIFLDPLDALTWSQKQAGKNNIIIITGSIYLGGELRPTVLKNRSN
jgi:dihydrofolate synthase/folylpolyglutamate synthase